MTIDKAATSSCEIVKTLRETSQKVEAALQPSVESHLGSDDFSPAHGLDFLDVKNSVLLSYTTELVHDLKNRLEGRDSSEASMHRLIALKTVIDKSRGLDRKLRYQIDKLMASGTNSSTFASAEDPLQFRPDTRELQEEEDEDPDSESGADGSEDDDLDDELAAARATVSNVGGKKSSRKSKTGKKPSDVDEGNFDSPGDGLYRAPRLQAVKYTKDKSSKDEEREKRLRKRARASELAQTLRDQYGEAPEQDDIHGGTELGRQREAARRFHEKQAEKTSFEEDAMIRLTNTRAEKKQQKKLRREETSNLSAIADLGNIMRDSAGSDRSRRKDARPSQHEDDIDKPKSGKKTRGISAKNSLQATLYGQHGSTKKKRSKK